MGVNHDKKNKLVTSTSLHKGKLLGAPGPPPRSKDAIRDEVNEMNTSDTRTSHFHKSDYRIAPGGDAVFRLSPMAFKKVVASCS